MVLPSISRLNPISAISNELPSLSAFNPLQAVKKDLPSSLLAAFATLGNMFERNDKEPDEDVRKVVRNIRTKSKSLPNTSTASVAGTAIRVGFKGPGETFKKNGNEYTVPDGFLYNEKTARMVQTTSIGTMPFRSFAFAGIDLKQSIFDNYRDREAVRHHRVQLFRRLDKIIDIMSKLTVSSPEDVVPGTPEREEEKEDKDKKSCLDCWDRFLSFFKKLLIDPILKALRKVISWIKSFIRSVVGAIFRVIGKVLEAIKRIGRVVFEYIKEIISYVKGALGPLWNTAAKFLGKAAKRLVGAAKSGIAAGKNVLNNMPGLSKLFAKLRVAGKGIPILGSLITPIIEGLEANSKLNELAKQKENGEITEQEFRQKSTEAVTQATLNTLGTVGGALIGSLLTPVLGPFGIIAGGVLGNQLAMFVGDLITPKIAAAINTNDVDQMVKDIVEFFSKDVPSFFSSIPDRIKSAFSGDTSTKVLKAFEDSKNSVSDLLGSGWNSVKDTTKSGVKWAKKKIGVHFGDIPSCECVERLEDPPHSTEAISPQNSIAVSPVPESPAKPLAVPDYDVGSSNHTVIIDNTKTTIVRNTNIPAPNYGYGYQNQYNPMAA